LFIYILHFTHENLNVSNLDRSIRFYNEALDLREVRRMTGDGLLAWNFTINLSICGGQAVFQRENHWHGLGPYN